MQEKFEEKTEDVVNAPAETKPASNQNVSVRKLSNAAKKTINVTKRNRLSLMTVQKKNQFIKLLEQSGDLRVAAAKVGISEATIKRMLSQDVRFAEAVSRANALYLGELETLARKLANGVDEAVYHQGEVVGYKTNYDSSMVKTLLKAADKDKYGDKKTIDTTTNINVNDTTSRNKLAGLLGVKLEEAKTIEDEEAIDGEWEDV